MSSHAADRSQRAMRRRHASPTQVGYLVSSVCETPPGTRELAPLIAELALQGPGALEELAARFPGPLWCDPRAAEGPLPHASEVGPIPAALLCLGMRAYPVVARLLSSPDPEDRLCAAAIARDFPSEEVLTALTALLWHADVSARRMALRALPALSHLSGYGQALQRLRELVGHPDAPPVIKTRAIEALSELGDRRVIGALVPLLRAPDAQLADSAHEALCALTAHDYGHSRRLWSRWLARHGHLPRHAWLLEGLRAHRVRLRRHAVAGLSGLLGGVLLDVGDECTRGECIQLAEQLATRFPNVALP